MDGFFTRNSQASMEAPDDERKGGLQTSSGSRIIFKPPPVPMKSSLGISFSFSSLFLFLCLCLSPSQLFSLSARFSFFFGRINFTSISMASVYYNKSSSFFGRSCRRRASMLPNPSKFPFLVLTYAKLFAHRILLGLVWVFQKKSKTFFVFLLDKPNLIVHIALKTNGIKIYCS